MFAGLLVLYSRGYLFEYCLVWLAPAFCCVGVFYLGGVNTLLWDSSALWCGFSDLFLVLISFALVLFLIRLV